MLIDWQDIETAPRDGTKVLVYLAMATVGLVHIAYWENGEQGESKNNGERLDAGWWSHTENSVGRSLLDGYRTPLFWAPYNPPKPY